MRRPTITRMGFEKMRVYQAAEMLDQEVKRLIDKIPAGRNVKDVKQLQGCCPAIPYNIGEAYGSEFIGTKINHLSISRGSADETRSILRKLARDGVLTAKDIQRACALAILVAKMLTAWIASLSPDDAKPGDRASDAKYRKKRYEQDST